MNNVLYVNTQAIKENFIEALNNLKKAFEDLAYYTGDAYIADAIWDGADNYPFDWSFDEMPDIVGVWIDAVKDNLETSEIHGTYDVVMYMSEIIPNWRDDNNLALVEIEGVVLYDWYKYIANIKDHSKWNPESFNKWVEDIQDADSVVGLYNYAKEHIISIKSFN